MTHGTFRNKISKLMNDGFVELQYCSGPAFYSIKGNTFTKPKPGMTDNHTVVSPLSSVSSVSFIDNLPADKYALHDIRLRFNADNIWTTIATNHSELKPNKVSKDIALDPIVTHDLSIKVTLHHTDIVSVIVACSLNPVAVDVKGLVRLSNALTRVEALIEYAGKEFEVTWEDGENALIRIYTKDLKDGKGIRIRTERQEYPNKRFDVAIEEKLNALGPS